MSEKLLRAVPPAPGQDCHEDHGAAVLMPDGTPLPGVLSVTITMQAQDRLRATIEVDVITVFQGKDGRVRE